MEGPLPYPDKVRYLEWFNKTVIIIKARDKCILSMMARRGKWKSIKF